MNTAPNRQCSRCGASIAADAPDGFCLRCLFHEGAAACQRISEPSSPSRLPEHFGDYEILGDLGRGAMGRVYRARQMRPDRAVALKVLSAREAASPDQVERLQIEAEAAASLDHPNIVSIYEAGEHEEWHFFSMRLVEGGTLSQTLARERLPFERCARLLATVARAIQHAHERGVLHRDIKPGNIMLDLAGEPHVTDFGLARFTERESDLTLTRTALGTPAYTSPEQAAGRVKEITTATDIYGLGAVLFEMLTGRPPFVGETAMAVARQVIELEPASPSSLNPAVPPDLAVICLKCLEKEPGRRYSSAATLADDLDRWLHHEPILARATTSWGRVSKWVRRKPAHAALAATVALALMALIAGLFWHNQRITRAGRATEAANRELASELRRVEWQQAEAMLASGGTPDAIALFARFLRETPGDLAAAARLRSLLEMRAFPLPLLPPFKHEWPVTQVKMERTGRHLWTIASDGVLRSWNRTNGLLEREAALNLVDHALHPLPDGRRLLLKTKAGRLLLWDYQKWQLDRELGEASSRLDNWSISQDGQWVSSVTPDNEVQSWETATGILRARTNLVAKYLQVAPGLGPAGETIVCARDRGAWLWRPAQHSFAPLLAHDGEIVCSLLDWPSQRAYLSLENTNSQCMVSVNLVTGREQFRNSATPAWHRMLLSADGAHLLVTRWGTGVSILETATLRQQFPAFDRVSAIAKLSADQAFRVGFIGLNDGSGRLRDLATSQPVMEPVQHQGIILSQELSPDGNWLVTASQDRHGPALGHADALERGRFHQCRRPGAAHGAKPRRSAPRGGHRA